MWSPCCTIFTKREITEMVRRIHICNWCRKGFENRYVPQRRYRESCQMSCATIIYCCTTSWVCCYWNCKWNQTQSYASIQHCVGWPRIWYWSLNNPKYRCADPLICTLLLPLWVEEVLKKHDQQMPTFIISLSVRVIGFVLAYVTCSCSRGLKTKQNLIFERFFWPTDSQEWPNQSWRKRRSYRAFC